MSQKIVKFLTIIITGFVTLFLLMGTTYLYNKVIYTDPLEASVKKLASIASFQVEKINSRSKIKVQFTIREKLRANFYLLLDQLEGQDYSEEDLLTIEIVNNENQKLRDFLTKAQLPVFEAISTGQFTVLPSDLENLIKDNDVQYELEVDNNFVFVTATSGKESAHLVISRGNSPLNIVNSMGGEYL